MRRNDQSAPVLIVGGSFGARSATAVLMKHMEEPLSERGFLTGLMSADPLKLPFYHPDLHAADCPEAAPLLAAFRCARAFVFLTPPSQSCGNSPTRCATRRAL